MIQRFLVYIQDKNALYFISFCISCNRLATTGFSKSTFLFSVYQVPLQV